MTLAERYAILMKKRKEIEGDIDFDNELIIRESIELLSSDISETINFLKKECTAEQFVWISEIFDEVVEETQSREFIDTLYELAKKYPKETEEYNIMYFIETAKDFLND